MSDRTITDGGLRARIIEAMKARHEDSQEGYDTSEDWNDPESVALICEELLRLRELRGRVDGDPDHEGHQRWIKEMRSSPRR